MKILLVLSLFITQLAHAEFVRLNFCDYQNRDNEWQIFWFDDFQIDTNKNEYTYTVSMRSWDFAYCIYLKTLSLDQVEMVVAKHKTKYKLEFDHQTCTGEGLDYKYTEEKFILSPYKNQKVETEILLPGYSKLGMTLVNYDEPRQSKELCQDFF